MDITLRQILSTLNTVRFKLIESGGELSEEDEKHLIEVEAHLPQKIDAYYQVVEMWTAEAAGLKAIADKYAKASKTITSLKDRLEARLLFVMTEAGVNELKGLSVNVIRKNNPEKVDDATLNLDLVPSEFFKIETTTTLDKVKLKEAIKKARKEDKEIPGASLTRGQKIEFVPGINIKENW